MKRGGQFAPDNTDFCPIKGGGQFAPDEGGHIDRILQIKDKNEKLSLMTKINEFLRDENSDYFKGVDFQIGHAYFLKNNSISDVINENIIPLLIEYYRGNLETVRGLMKLIGFQLDEEHFKQHGLLRY